MKKPILSIIITSFNSEKTIPLVFRALKKQTLSSNLVEIIVIDGGSTDQTLQISRRNNTLLVHNPRVEQNYGKYLGYLRARGRYLMFLDSDEVLENRNCLQNRIKIFESYPQIKAVIGSGLKNPPSYPFINKYINDFGDPFSYFMYRTPKSSSFFMKMMVSKYSVVKTDDRCIIFDFSKVKTLPLIELTGGASMIDVQYIKKEFPEIKKRPELLNHMFYLLQSKSPRIAIAKKDALIHYSSNNTLRYLHKISWRVKNNIYHVSTMGMAGFMGRNKYFYENKSGIKKFLFIPYAYTLVFPLADSFSLSLSRKDIGYLFHLPLCLYTANQIIYHSFLKIIGFKPRLLSYGINKPI
jgi:glycosyltransferase involved in cell wall biosynthesis